MTLSMDVVNESFYEDCDTLQNCNKPQLSNDPAVFDDEHLLEFVRAFQENGNFTPIIKEELKQKIQERRRVSGQEHIVLSSETQQTLHELTPGDVERREVRKEQNRRAARKYRGKQRDKASVVRKEMDQLENHNVELSKEIKKLHQEKNELYQILQNHLQECVLGQCVIPSEPWQVSKSSEPWNVSTSPEPWQHSINLEPWQVSTNSDPWSQFTKTFSGSSI